MFSGGTKENGKCFRVGIFLDFARSSTRTVGPHGGASYVQVSGRDRIGPQWNGGEIERMGVKLQ